MIQQNYSIGAVRLTSPLASAPKAHGTARAYGAGCRCRECAKAQAAYRAGVLGFSEHLGHRRIHASAADTWPSRA